MNILNSFSEHTVILQMNVQEADNLCRIKNIYEI